MESIRRVVMHLSIRVSKAQENVETIQSLVQQWREAPLFTRCEEGRSDFLLNTKGA